MQRIGWLLLAGMACSPLESHAQGLLVGPNRFPIVRRGESIAYPTLRSGRVRIYVGFLAPVPYGLAPFDPFGYPPVEGRIRIFTIAPIPPPILVTALPLVPLPRSLMDDPDIPPVPGPDLPRRIVPDVPRLPAAPPVPPKPMPPPRLEEPKDPPKKEPPKPPRKRSGEPTLPRPPALPDDPRDAHAQLVERGLEAFAELQYGRAVQRFRQATRLLPAEPLPQFLLAQALLAQRKYHAAHDAVLAGLRLRPDWPTSKFRPLELYGTAVGEYPEHMTALQETLRRHPDDPVLLFLLAYQLWFDGRRDEATPLFRRALPRSGDREAIDRFLRELPAVDL